MQLRVCVRVRVCVYMYKLAYRHMSYSTWLSISRRAPFRIFAPGVNKTGSCAVSRICPFSAFDFATHDDVSSRTAR